MKNICWITDLIRLSEAGFDLKQVSRFIFMESGPNSNETVRRNPDSKEEWTDQPLEKNENAFVVPPSEVHFPESTPQYPFMRISHAETLKPLPRPLVPKPITDDALKVDWGGQGVPLQPLEDWSKMVGWIRKYLLEERSGHRVDYRKLEKIILAGNPVTQLPRVSIKGWVPRARVLLDRTPEMYPFFDDAVKVCAWLQRDLGKCGLEVTVVKGESCLRSLALEDLKFPTLAISAMGHLSGSRVWQEAWRDLGNQLQRSGCLLLALVPCPAMKWNFDLAMLWNSKVWDHGTWWRGSSLSLDCYKTESIDRVKLYEDLLALLSGSSLVGTALLRATRRLLGSGADVGLEYEVWFRKGGWSSQDCFGFKQGEDYQRYLAARKELAITNPSLVNESSAFIEKDHQPFSVAIRLEAELRLCFTGEACSEEQKKRSESVFTGILDRLRNEAKDPGSEEGRHSGLADWFERMTNSLSPEILQSPEWGHFLAEGLAYARHYNQSENRALPEGMLISEFARASKDLEKDEEACLTEVQLIRDTIVAALKPDVPSGKSYPLGFLGMGGPRRIYVSCPGTRPFDPINFNSLDRLCVIQELGSPQEFELTTDQQRLHFEVMQRPKWARRMWYDRYGMAVDFEIGGAVFVMRWIPPGRFMMGSPEDEPGRREWEGPQHEVTITEGFWLGETPVTKRQFEAAEKEKGRVSREKTDRFEGLPELPVENISWNECQAFIGQLNQYWGENWGKKYRRKEVGLEFHLPYEAQWEYACRAGTETALYSGGITIKGEHHAPELDSIAWYGGNSGKDLEVKEPYKGCKEWKEKQYDFETAGTHRVKQKKPNGWGLYDMLGNVWEWCEDPWREGYEAEAVVNPFPKKDQKGSDGASRVVRGGSWYYLARNCRSAYRNRLEPDHRVNNLGFRLAAGQPRSGNPVRSGQGSGSGSG